MMSGVLLPLANRQQQLPHRMLSPPLLAGVHHRSHKTMTLGVGAVLRPLPRRRQPLLHTPRLLKVSLQEDLEAAAMTSFRTSGSKSCA